MQLWVRLAIVFLCCVCFAQRSRAHTSSEFLLTKSYVFEDKKKQLAVRDVVNRKHDALFQEVKNEGSPSFGLTRNPVWARVEIEKSKATRQELLLEIPYPLIDSVTLYKKDPRSSEIQSLSQGLSHSYTWRAFKHRNLVFPISDCENGCTFYLNVVSETPISLPMNIDFEDHFWEKHAREDLFVGGFFGLLALMFAYSFFHFVMTKERFYLYYLMGLTSAAGFQLVYLGLGPQLLWPNSPFLAKFVLPMAQSLGPFAMAGFAKSMLHTKINSKISHMLLTFVAIMALVQLAVSSFNFYWGQMTIQIGGLIGAACVSYAAIDALSKRIPEAKIFAVACGFLFLGFAIHILKNLGVMPSTWLTHFSITFGTAIEFTVWSMAFGNRLSEATNKLQHAKIKAMESEQKLADLARVCFDWFWETDRFGRLIFMSEAALQKLGSSASEISSKEFLSLVNENEKDFVREIFSRQSSMRVGFHEIECCLRTKSGQQVWVLMNAVGLRDSTGHFSGYRGAFVDITSRKLAESEAEKERMKSIHGAKMATLGEMAGGIAHEINNPLAILSACNDNLKVMVERNQYDSDKIFKIVGKTEKTILRIAKIIRGLRAFARDSGSDPFEKVQLSQLMEDTLEFCVERFKAHAVLLRVDEIPKDWHLECRAVQISEVILNLLSNAFDAVYLLPEKWIQVQCTQIDGWFQICIVDSGNGIPEDIRPKIMQPFFTTKQVGKGSGLGLSLSKGIVEQHGGTIEIIRDHPNTCFVIKLPITQKRKLTA